MLENRVNQFAAHKFGEVHIWREKGIGGMSCRLGTGPQTLFSSFYAMKVTMSVCFTEWKKGIKQEYDIRLVLTFVTEFFNLT